MFIKTEKVHTHYKRQSKLGKKHEYLREKTVVHLQCDNCDTVFTRDLKKMNSSRLNNNYFHVCTNCDAKRFAQRKGVEQKQVWDLPSNTDLPLSKF